MSRRAGRGLLIDAMTGLAIGVAFIYLITEPQPIDPMVYLNAAQDPASAPIEHRTTRLGLVLPTYLVSLVFGFSEFTFYFVPVLALVVLGAAISNIGRLIFSDWVGPVAALATVSATFIMPFATQLLTDVPATAALSVALAMVLRALSRGRRAQMWMLLGAGCALGVAYSIRETSLLWLPGLVLVAVLVGLALRGAFLILVGSLVGPITDVVGGLALWGDPLARVSAVIGRTDTPPEISVEAAEYAFAAQSNVFEAMSLLPRLLWEDAHGRVLVVGAVAYVVFILLRRIEDRSIWALPVWVVCAWVLFGLVGSIEPESGRPVLRLVLGRYWAPFIPAFALMTFGSLALMTDQIRSRARMSAVMGGVLGAMLVVVGTIHVTSSFDWFMRLGADEYWDLRDSMTAVPTGIPVNLPARIDSVASLYANDPVGRPLASTISVSADSPPARHAFYLFQEEGVSPVDSSGSTHRWPPEGYAIAEADDRLRWILFGPAEEGRESGLVVREISFQDDDGLWLQRSIVDGESSPEEMLTSGRVAVEEGDSLVVYEGAGPHGVPGGSQEGIPPGSIVAVFVDLTVRRGLVEVECQFSPMVEESSTGVSVSATSMTAIPPHSGSRGFFCLAPTGRSSHLMRALISFAGETNALLNGMEIVVFPPP